MNSNLKSRFQIMGIMILIMLLGSFVATQLTAVNLYFSPILGKPWIKLLRLYNPLDFWVWAYRYSDIPQLSHHFTTGWVCITVSAVSVFGIAWVMNIIGWVNKQKSDTHGSAHFATLKEVKKSGLFYCYDDPAVYVGAYQPSLGGKIHYLRDASSTHVFVFAPSRSGKGVGLIIPTLLAYSSSVIISDFKLENWHLTAGFRQAMGHKVLKFDPTCTDGSAAQFNPLFEIRQGQHEVRDTQLIADMLVNPDGKGKRDHWTKSAHSLLVTTILHVLYAEEDKSLAGVRLFLANPACSEDETLQKMLDSNHPIISSGAREMLNKAEEERSGIISSALSFLDLYRDPIIANMTRRHDFSIQDLVYYEKPVSLYIGTPPSDIERSMPLMRLMLQMILTRLTETLEDANNQKRKELLLMLDEFPQFGRLPFFEKAMSYCAGYKIRAYLISQDMQQIYKEYGHDQSIISNCGIRIAYAPNTLETAKYLSESLGYSTVRQKQVNYSGNRFNGVLNHMNVSEHDIKRPLLMPDELTRLPEHAVMIFKNGIAPIYGHKIYYYSDPILSERAVIPPPECSDKLSSFLSAWQPAKVDRRSKDVSTEDKTNYVINWLSSSKQ